MMSFAKMILMYWPIVFPFTRPSNVAMEKNLNMEVYSWDSHLLKGAIMDWTPRFYWNNNHWTQLWIFPPPMATKISASEWLFFGQNTITIGIKLLHQLLLAFDAVYLDVKQIHGWNGYQKGNFTYVYIYIYVHMKTVIQWNTMGYNGVYRCIQTILWRMGGEMD